MDSGGTARPTASVQHGDTPTETTKGPSTTKNPSTVDESEEESVGGGGRGAAEDSGAVSMAEVLAGWQSLEEEASVQGMEEWGDDSRCTYLEGGEAGTTFVQPMYSCYDCMEKAGVPFAFCFGCSMNCHLDHRLEEVFDKRDLRCDCGAGFLATAAAPCQLMDKSMTEGYCQERYGHNFVGRYCWCDLPYNADEDEMIQCLVCQDWYHIDCIAAYPNHRGARSSSTQRADRAVTLPHNGLQTEKVAADLSTTGDEAVAEEPPTNAATVVPDSDNYENFVCATCVAAHPLMRRTASFAVLGTSSSGDDNSKSQSAHGKVTETERSPKGDSEGMRSLFLSEGWKGALCRCEECQAAFREDSLGFLFCKEVKLNSGTAGAAVPPSIMDVSMNALEEAVPSVTRRLDLARGMQHFTDTLRSVLSPLAERGETVTPEHIKDFVAQLKKK